MQFVYCDTNIISHLAKNKDLWSQLHDFLEQNSLILGISGAQVVELSDAGRLHRTVAELFTTLPSAVLKTWDTVLAEEVRAHPQQRRESLVLYPLNSPLLRLDNMQKLHNCLSSANLYDARKDQLSCAQQMPTRHAQLKGNFSPSKSGLYTRTQADEFSWMQVMQWLIELHCDFLKGFQDNIESFLPEVFLSVRLFAYMIYYKYYLGQREPKEKSDFGDMGHLYLIPYCALVIMERDLCNVLGQIKDHSDILKSTAIRNVDFFKDWSWH